MLDIKFIRENADLIKKNNRNRGVDVDVDQLIDLDEKRRSHIAKLDEIRALRNKTSKGKPSNEDILRMREVGEHIAELEQDLNEIDAPYKQLLLEIPNLILPTVPFGGEKDYKVLATHGEPTKFDFEPKDHLKLGEALDIIDVKRAVKVSGGRFAYLKGAGALLEFALVQYAMSKLVKEGFIPIIPPVLIRLGITEKLGYWQKGGNENYYLVSDFEKENENSKEQANPLYLVGTGEHAVVPMHSEEVIPVEELPKKYAAFSSCFRREAGTYGKDTNGILRVHQFDKVEMVAFVRPQDDETERRKMLEMAQSLLEDLELPYRTIQLASKDLSTPAAETIDIETWIPSQNVYRETHSISTTTEYQSRRLDVKYQEGKEKQLVHILNGTALAIGRTIIAILENYQTADGTIRIPKVLQPYMGGLEEIR